MEDDYLVFQGMPTDTKGNVAVSTTLTAVSDDVDKTCWAFVSHAALCTLPCVRQYQKRKGFHCQGGSTFAVQT